MRIGWSEGTQPEFSTSSAYLARERASFLRLNQRCHNMVASGKPYMEDNDA